MAGKIRDEDIALIRDRTSIVDVISERVTLKSAGSGNVKGLCPFHDEKTPSFTVSAARNVYFCHGCGAGGDAIRFVMDVEHLSFVEAIERLAARAGIELHYVEGGPAPVRANQGQKQRLIAANKAAAEFYAAQLTTAAARTAREFLAARGFDRAAALAYGCGFATDGWDGLVTHLRAGGFSASEMEAAGLAKPARSGSLIDRFRRRLIWPIRDLGGDVIGFGARKLFDDDDGPKYLNTPETLLYKKSHVLYGIEQAKREIARQGRAVIVEGYTDVMACHLAGVPTAVATCGTAFGADHIGVLRRLLMDTDALSGEIIFTFDGDAAGQKAALRAFGDDQRFVAQTFIAVSPDNMDPCELRLAKGDASVRDLVARREPMIAFALRSVLSHYNLDTAEGRVGALREAAPLVAKIKDRALRPEYARKLAGDLGMEIETVAKAVGNVASAGQVGPPVPSARKHPDVPAQDAPLTLVEREALKLAIQSPALAGPMFDAITPADYAYPLHVVIRQAIADVGGLSGATGGAVWVEKVREACGDLTAAALVGELAVEPLRIDGEADPRYVAVTLARLQLASVMRRLNDVKSRVQRINPVTQRDEYLALAGELFSLEQHARALREQAVGGL
ncbi:MAG TPA: DNA primase [Micromonosporaceae bacterium]|nr:DNA primase [Micromonosporaceae bacterium]